jgi:hypothetical protein
VRQAFCVSTMAEEAAPEPESGIDDFLLAEYEHFADSFWRTEELGEKRLSFFISLLTAAVAGLVVLATRESDFTDAQVQWVAFSVGLALLLVGLSTLLRMLRRNNVADQYLGALRHIRKSFCTRYALEGYRPIDVLPRKLFTGGLAQTSALINSMIAGGLTAVGLVAATSPALLGLSAAIVFALCLAAQFAYISRRHRPE